MFSWLDEILISFFKITGVIVLDYLLGIFIVAMISILLGELSSWVAYRLNSSYIKSYFKIMKEKELLALEAQRQGENLAYKGLNEEATDYWGKHFFLTSAISIGSLWPIPFVIYWLGLRFEEVRMPVTHPLSWIFPDGMGYISLYVTMYFLARLIVKYLILAQIKLHKHKIQGILASLKLWD